MAWTTPKTWTAAGSTASELNTHIRDNMRETMPYLADSLGDLFIGDAANSLVVVPVGTQGQVLQANSAATSGWNWATITGKTHQVFTLPMSGDQAATRVGTYGPAYINSASADDSTQMSMVVPSNFVTLVGLSVVYNLSADGTGSNLVLSATVHNGQLGSSLTSTVIERATVAESASLQDFDVSTGVTLVAGDLLGVQFTRYGTDSADGEVNGTVVWGLYLEYTD